MTWNCLQADKNETKRISPFKLKTWICFILSSFLWWSSDTFDTCINLNLADFVMIKMIEKNEIKIKLSSIVRWKISMYVLVYIHTGRERKRERVETLIFHVMLWKCSCFEWNNSMQTVFDHTNTMSRSTFSVLVIKKLIGFYKMLLFLFFGCNGRNILF